MPNSTHTIYDIAREAQVSSTTVSRVLNGSSRVSEKTRNRILKIIDRLEFVPKAEARARALRANHRIGILSPPPTSSSFGQRLRGISSTLASTNFEQLIYTVTSTNRLDSYLASLPLTSSLDGLIIISLPINEQQVQHLISNHLETVLIEYPQSGFNTVEIDDIEGGRMAADYLAEKGHTRIAFLGDTDLPEYSIHPITLRLEGFRQRLSELHISLPGEYLRLAPYNLEQSREMAHELLTLPKPPTAIFSATDLQAMGVIVTARQMGLKVPGDLAILGFDDLDISEVMELTTIRQPLDESGQVAVELLLARLENPSRSLQHVKLPLTIVERNTV